MFYLIIILILITGFGLWGLVGGLAGALLALVVVALFSFAVVAVFDGIGELRARHSVAWDAAVDFIGWGCVVALAGWFLLGSILGITL